MKSSQDLTRVHRSALQRPVARDAHLLFTSCLMVVADLDVVRVSVLEPETDSPLVVHGDRVLARPIALQRMEPIARRNAQNLDFGVRTFSARV